MRRNYTSIILIISICLFFEHINAQTIRTVGLSGNYSTLKGAFDAINAGSITGNIELHVISSTIETATASLNASGVGLANYTSVNIYPTISGVSISGNFNTPLVQLYGSDDVTIDGRVNATGSLVNMTIVNANTGSFSSAIKYLNSAENNIIRYCYLKSSCYSSGIGIIQFSSSNIGNGNDNNIIEYCNITNAGGNRPLNAIFTSGGSARENSGNIIRNNNIYDIFNPNATSYGIMISYLSTDWIISENSFYETTEIVPVGAFNYIPIYENTGANTITHNYIGGSASNCSSSPMTINSNTASYFCGIYVNGGTLSSVENNIIQNISFTSVEDNPFDGIFINSGNVNVTGNTIGNTTGTGSIIISAHLAVATTTISGGKVTGINLLDGGSGYTTAPTITFSTAGSSLPATATATISGGVVTGFTITNDGGTGYTSAPSVIFDGQSNGYSTSHGMIQNSFGTVNIINNNIGSITIVGSNYYSHGFESIYVRGNTTNVNISNNLIGSLTTANSIYTSSKALNSLQKQDVYGIYSSGIGNTLISGNTVANLTNGYEGTNSGSKTIAISTTAGSNTLQNNTIKYISTPNGQVSSGASASVIGISQTSTLSGTTQTLSGNTVSDLSNTNTSRKEQVEGIYYTGPIDGTNIVSRNFVHNLSVSSSDIGAYLYGIVVNSGVVTCANNIINLGLGITTGVFINGIWDGSSNSSHIVNFYFNSVYVGGNVSTGTTSNTAGLWNANNTAIRDYRNNILLNARTGGSSGKHYAIRLAGMANVTIDYNDYSAPGSGVIGRIGTLDKNNLAAWKLATTQDNNSLEINPLFTVDGSASALDYYTSAVLPGVLITGITTDYASNTRSIPPKIGALESNSYVWQGGVSTDFSTASNWINGIVPPNGADISFAANPDRSCVLDQNRTLGSITNAQSTDVFVMNGFHLTLTKDLVFSNGAQIDATASSSIIEFAGTSIQNIPIGTFVSNTVSGININNSNGVILNNDLTLSETLVLTNGALALGANTININGSVFQTSGTLIGGVSTNIIFGGNGANTILPAVMLNNLTINRSNGITLNGNVTIGNALTLTSGTLTVASNVLTLSGNTLTVTSGNIDASNSSSSLVFANSAAITLPTTLFSGDITNLKITGNGGLISLGNLKVNGILDLHIPNPSATKGIFDFGVNTLTMGANATTVGVGDVTGIVKRTSFLANTSYTFGNQFTTMTIAAGGTMPSDIRFKITIGSAPFYKSDAIQRNYDIVRTGGSGTTASYTFHYLDSELNSNTENNMVVWDYHLDNAGLVEEHGKAVQNTTDKWIGISNRSITYSGTVFDNHLWTLGNTVAPQFLWQGTPSDDWNDVNNWSGGVVPDLTSDVIIPSAATTVHSPTLPATAFAKTITIQSEGILNAGTVSSLTIAGSGGAWINEGDFIAGSSTVIFTHANATISGITNFNNVTINLGAALTPQTGNIMRIAGTLINNGILRAALLSNTIEFNGADQTIVNTNALPQGYYNLILSGSGIKTMPVSDLSIYGDFSMLGTSSTTAASPMTILGNVIIETGSTFITGNFAHSIGGNFENNGTFTSISGNLIAMNGSVNQLIFGNSLINFDNLTINNINNVSILNDVNVNNVLTLTSGNLDVEQSTLGINGTISKTAGFLDVNSLSSLSFGGTSAIIFDNNLFYSSPSINNLTINRSGGVSLGNQNLTINGLLDLQSGTFSVVANTLTIAKFSPTKTSGLLDVSNLSATLIFTNPDAIILPPSMFLGNVNNLTINGTGGISANNDLTINGILNLQTENPIPTKGSLDMQSNTLTMAANATTVGLGDVTGIVKRTVINPNVTYTFGNQFTNVYFPNIGTLPSEMSVKISIGTAPVWRPGAIQREIEIIQTAGSNTKGTFSYHYTDDELNGNIEDNLILWVGLTPINYEYGRSAYNSADKWVSLSNVNVAFFSSTWSGTKNVTLDEYGATSTLTWNGSLSDSWTSIENWTPNVGPSPVMNIIIPDASTTLNSPTLPVFTEIKTLTIEAAGVLNSVGNAQLTINGSASAWSNVGGTFNPNTSDVIFTNADATFSGTTNFYDVTINPLSVLSMVSGSTMRLAGTMTNLGSWNTFELGGNTTVEYNGTDQTVVIPDVATNRYSNLILSGSGTKTLPSASLNVLGNLTINAAVSATGNTIVMSGTQAQTIDGTLSTSFNNLTIDNASGVSLGNNETVSGTLDLSNGLISTGANTITVADGGSISNASASSYVDGKLARVYSSTVSHDFPIGKGGYYRPLSLKYNYLTGTSTVTAEQFEAALPGTAPASINLLPNRYWSISQSGGSAYNYSVTLDGTGWTPTYTPKIIKGNGLTNVAYDVTTPNYTNALDFTTPGNITLGDTYSILPTCNTYIARTITPPAIDNSSITGEVWMNVPAKSIEKTITAPPTDIPAGSWRALYDNNNLYVLVEVTDANPWHNSATNWQGDGIELYIDGDNNSGLTSYSGSQYQLRFNYIGSGSISTPTGGSALSGAVISASTYTVYRTASGYTLKVAIPWTAIKSNYLTSNTGLRMEVAVNQTSQTSGTTTRSAQLASFTTSNQLASDPSLFSFVNFFEVINAKDTIITPNAAVQLSASASVTPDNITWVSTPTGNDGTGSPITVNQTADTKYLITASFTGCASTSKEINVQVEVYPDTIVWTNNGGDGDWDNYANWIDYSTKQALNSLSKFTDSLTVIIPAPTNSKYLTGSVNVNGGVRYPYMKTPTTIKHNNTLYMKNIKIEYGASLFITPLLNKYTNAEVSLEVADRNEWILVGPNIDPYENGVTPRSMISGDYYLNATPQVYMNEMTLSGSMNEEVSWSSSFANLDKIISSDKGFAIKIPDQYGKHKVSGKYFYRNDATKPATIGQDPVGYTFRGKFLNEITNPTISTKAGLFVVACNTFASNISAKNFLDIFGGQLSVWSFNDASGGTAQPGSFTTYNAGTVPLDLYIKPMQAFMYLDANATDRVITLVEADICDVNSSSKYRARALVDRKPTIEIVASSADYSSKTSIVYDKNLSNGAFNYSKDIVKLFSGYDETPDLYSYLGSNRLQTQTINTLNDIVPLGIRTGVSDSVKLVITGTNEFEGASLVDKQSGITYDLSGDTTTINLDVLAGTNADRLYLTFSPVPNVITNIKGNENKLSLKIYTEDHKHVIISNSDNSKVLEILVIDMTGRVTRIKPNNDNYHVIDMSNYAASVYTVRVVTNKNTKAKKIEIR